jgi:hypothetical protein
MQLRIARQTEPGLGDPDRVGRLPGHADGRADPDRVDAGERLGLVGVLDLDEPTRVAEAGGAHHLGPHERRDDDRVVEQQPTAVAQPQLPGHDLGDGGVQDWR